MALPDGYPDATALEAALHLALDQLQADAILWATGAWDASAGVPRDAMAYAFRALPDAGAGKLAALAQAGPAPDVRLQSVFSWRRTRFPSHIILFSR